MTDSEVAEFLSLGVNMYLACLTPEGYPYATVCWHEWRDGYFAPFSSVDRFVLTLFPLAGWLASRLAPRPFALWIAVSSALMVGAAAVHLSGGWVG